MKIFNPCKLFAAIFAAALASSFLTGNSLAQAPSPITIPCPPGAIQGPPGNLKRFPGDLSPWNFELVPEEGVTVKVSSWEFNGQNPLSPVFSEQTWGTLAGGGQSLSLSWLSGPIQGTFSVKVRFKRYCAGEGQGGAGTVPEETLEWGGIVNGKMWQPLGTGIVAESGNPPRMLAPQNRTLTPSSPVTVSVPTGGRLTCKVETATDSDKWTLGGNTATEDDEVIYAWSSSQGAFDDSSMSSTAWTAPTDTGIYTLKCVIDDKWADEQLPAQTGVTGHDIGSRNDENITLEIQVIVFSATIEVKRKEVIGLATHAFGGSASIAAGGIETPVHQAEIRVQFTPAVAGIRLSKDQLEIVGKEAPPVGDSGDAVGNIEGTSDTSGTIFGSFTSSAKMGPVILKLKTGQLGEIPQAIIFQGWDSHREDNWTFNEDYFLDEASTVQFHLRYTDNSSSVAIPSHNVFFETIKEYGWYWDTNLTIPAFRPAIWTLDDSDVNAGPDTVVIKVPYEGSFMTYFGIQGNPLPVGDPMGTGQFSQTMTTPSSSEQVVLSSIWQVKDLNVYTEAYTSE